MHTKPPSHSTSTGPSSSIDLAHVQAEQVIGLPVEPEDWPKRISKAPPCGTEDHRVGHEASVEGHARPPHPHTKHYTREHKVQKR